MLYVPIVSIMRCSWHVLAMNAYVQDKLDSPILAGVHKEKNLLQKRRSYDIM